MDIILFLLLFFINKIVYKKSLNYVSCILLVWFIIIIITKINPYDMFEIKEVTYHYIYQFVFSFEILSILFYKCSFFKRKSILKKDFVDWNICNILMVLCLIIIFPFAVKGLIILMKTGSFNSVRDAYLNYEICSNKMYLLTTLIVVPIAEAIGYISITEAYYKKKINVTNILFIMFLVELIIETGGRSRIFNYVILLIVLAFFNAKNIYNVIKKNKKIIVVVLLIIPIMLLITSQRKLGGNSTLMYNIYSYLTGGTELLNAYLSNEKLYYLSGATLLNGQVLFSGILYPLYFVLGICGFEIKTGYYIINEVTSQFLPISNYSLLNNGGTFIYYALRDFGKYGPLIYTTIFSYILSKLYISSKKKGDLLSKTLFFYVFIKFIFFYQEYTFGVTSTIVTIITIMLLIRNGEYYYERKKNKK